MAAGIKLSPATCDLTESETCLTATASDCLLNPDIDLAVLFDQSGSMDPRELGQTYNIQIEGLVSALSDHTLIPRDGSIALSVTTFSDQATLRIPLTEITSATVAEMLASAVRQLSCAGIGTCPSRGPNPATNFGNAVRFADELLSRARTERRRGARQVIVMSTEGECTDNPDCGSLAAADFGSRAGTLGELDIILVGNTNTRNRENADRIVFPVREDGLPGATLSIQAGSCNSGNERCPADDFARQVTAFSNSLRGILRSHVKPARLKVASSSDLTAASTSDGLTLRQAIEIANARGGETDITFELSATSSDNTITLNSPLPPIIAPGIRLNGCQAGGDTAECVPSITIDGTRQICDGLFIRSNRVEVRGMKIVNFERAGIVCAPMDPCDHVGLNTIEANLLENNRLSGVLILDPIADSANAVVHNERNSILGNTIIGSRTPIDLGGDGPTRNDDGDTDSGTNTLINFPVVESVQGSPTRAIIKGQLCGEASAGFAACQSDISRSRVDLFAVTRLVSPPLQQTAAATDRRLISGVRFIGRAVVQSDGSFEIEAGESPTCGYTATVTDPAGNTSELALPCQGFGKALLSKQVLEFPEAGAGQAEQTTTFAIENQGCGELTLISGSATRIDTQAGRITNPKDRLHFSIEGIPAKGSGTTPLVLSAGEQRDFVAHFRPVIPPVVTSADEAANGGLAARDVLPRDVRSVLNIKQSGGLSTLNLKATVRPQIKMIDPSNTDRPPAVSVKRIDDSYFVTFSIYDSALDDIDHAIVEFFDRKRRPVAVDNPRIEFRDVILRRRLVEGQSFTAVTEFANAGQHPEVGSVSVTVFGGRSGTSDSADSSNPVALSIRNRARASAPRPMKQRAITVIR